MSVIASIPTEFDTNTGNRRDSGVIYQGLSRDLCVQGRVAANSFRIRSILAAPNASIEDVTKSSLLCRISTQCHRLSQTTSRRLPVYSLLMTAVWREILPLFPGWVTSFSQLCVEVLCICNTSTGGRARDKGSNNSLNLRTCYSA